MPGIVKVKVMGARDLPVMDRASDLTDAFVEVRHGNTIHKTEVCRKSLNPAWNSEWFRFEADDEELQDEPLQVKVVDYDMYSAHDTIGKVMIGLSSLLVRNGTNEMGGWFPIFDTLHGIRGYIQINIKVDFFVDTNRYRQTSCGIRFFSTPGIPSGFTAATIQGFVDVLVVNDDPEYQWIDKIRTPRASNDARLRLFSKLSGEVNRRLGLKVIEAGGNAVVGYCQCFDIEGDTGIVVRGIGTSVTLVRNEGAHSTVDSLADSPDATTQSPALANFLNDPFHLRASFDILQKAILSRQSSRPMVLSGRYNRTVSSSSDGNENLNETSLILNASSESPDATFAVDKDTLMMNLGSLGHKIKSVEDLEFPFFTITKLPPGFVFHLGGIVSAKSVKLLDEINNPDEPETREAWWNEIRAEIRSHAKALGCHAVLGYSESTTIWEDLMILQATGTAAIVSLPDLIATERLHVTPDTPDFELRKPRSMKTSLTEEEDEEDGPFGTKSRPIEVNFCDNQKNAKSAGFDCRVCHVPFVDSDLPVPMNLSKCMICKQGKVPDIIFATIEPPPDVLITGTGCLIQARVYRSKKREKDEVHAENISQILPFMEYELHRQILNKLKVKSMNAIFGIRMQVTIGENIIIGLMTGTAIYLTALPGPPLFLVTGSKNDSSFDEKKLVEIQKRIIDETTKNRARMNLCENLDIFATQTPPNTPVFNIGATLSGTSNLPDNLLNERREDVQGQLDLTYGVKETYVVTVDDNIDDDILSTLTDSFHAEGGHAFNIEMAPGIYQETTSDVQFLTMFHRRKLSEDDVKINTIFPKICEDLIQSMHFKLRRKKPYYLSKISFNLQIPEDNDLQVILTASVLKTSLEKVSRKSTISTALRGSQEDEDLVFPIEVPDIPVSSEDMIGKTNEDQGKLAPQHLAHTWPATNFNDVRTLLFIHGTERYEMYGEPVIITSVSEVAHLTIEKYLGNLNLFFIRETTSIKEDGGLNMFMQSFIAEVHAVVKAQAAALGGNGIIAFALNDVILLDSSHKNQLHPEHTLLSWSIIPGDPEKSDPTQSVVERKSQCLLSVNGDVVRFRTKNNAEEDIFPQDEQISTFRKHSSSLSESNIS